MKNRDKSNGKWPVWVKVLTILITYHFSLITSTAQIRALRYDCMEAAPSNLPQLGEATAAENGTATLSLSGGQAKAPRRLPALKTQWDPERIYPVCVVLMSFSDCDFQGDDPQDHYNRIFNEEGYNEGRGPGCVADYFVRQSEGWFHPRFDVYGPVKVSSKSNSHSSSSKKYGAADFRTALQTLADSLSLDFSPYDWDADGKAEHVVFVWAGYGGNEKETQGKGYIWPNTSSFSSLTIGNTVASNYSASAELWSNDRSCGIGTICHEFSHMLGLPDLYPTSTTATEYSVVDEWDLMDGGNFINNGWCPCNYSAYEKHLLGWLQLEELTEDTAISNLQPVSEGGKAYLIRHTDREFLVIENRQWTGWDLRTPGRGLLIAHVDDMASAGNSVNNDAQHHRYDYFHADNLSYDQWDVIVTRDSLGRTGGHSPYLSGTAYPCMNDSVNNHELTLQSVPASTMFNANAEGSTELALPITNIRLVDDDELGGVVSFNVGQSFYSSIAASERTYSPSAEGVYNLRGQRVGSNDMRHGQIYLVRKTNGTITKLFF